MQIKWYVWFFSITAFLLALYLVELGPWGADQVGKYNKGYGTFDMKKYDVKEVQMVLSSMAPEGFSMSYRYYVSDMIFIVFFGLLQILISLTVYPKQSNSRIWILLGFLALLVPILRGIFDFTENCLLVYILKSYPALNSKLITAASVATQCKLLCIRLWAVLIGIGILSNLLIFGKSD